VRQPPVPLLKCYIQSNPTIPVPVIAAITLEMRIDHAQSLKDKRQVVKSLKDRLRDRFNVSVAEIADQDLWQRGVLAVVTVATSRVVAEETVDRVEREAAKLLGAMLVRANVEWL